MLLSEFEASRKKIELFLDDINQMQPISNKFTLQSICEELMK
jgi:hypothetical protein